MSIRPVKHESRATPAMEGAGVHLHRVFGFGDPSLTDPFLMMDDFRNDNPAHYQKGFPWHPHRGIETITYVLAGTVEQFPGEQSRTAVKIAVAYARDKTEPKEKLVLLTPIVIGKDNVDKAERIGEAK